MGEIEVEPGIHDITVEFVGSHGTVLFVEEYPQSDIQLGGLNLVKSCYLR